LTKDKPLYLREPWNILFRDNKLNKISPWNIDLVYLLTTLLEEMNKVGIDFRIAGTAIDSSVMIYKKKAELLLKMEEPPEEPPDKLDVYIPPPLALPFRFEFTTTTISDLISALERALTEEKRAPKTKLPTLPVPIPDFLEAEAYLLEIEDRADELFIRLKSTYKEKLPLSFFDLVSFDDPIEVVRVFMMLLFLAQRDKIDLYQDEQETDILVNVKGTVQDE
jgi:chromatin segregation and condensation protein Rec8/ScpA/Scc1 (kleisin family)